MEDNLPAGALDIHCNSIARQLMICRDTFRRKHQTACQLRIFILETIECREVTPRNNQNMRRRLRIDVFERDDVVIFVDDIGLELAGYEFTEQAIRIRLSHR